MNNFSKMIAARRAEIKDMTILKLAIVSGISPQSVFNIEHGNGCNLKSAIALCKALGINSIPVE